MGDPNPAAPGTIAIGDGGCARAQARVGSCAGRIRNAAGRARGAIDRELDRQAGNSRGCAPVHTGASAPPPRAPDNRDRLLIELIPVKGLKPNKPV
jgi:hypothetical protein